MSNDKLLPCPFCGGEAGLDQNAFGLYKVECFECGNGTEYVSEQNAISAWNTRAKNNQDAAEIERLTAENATLKDDVKYWKQQNKAWADQQLHLCDELAALREAQRRVPVGERLPKEPHGCLLIVEEDDYYGEPHEVLLPYFAGYDGDWWNDGDGQRVPFEVTHWMPLPARPNRTKRKENDGEAIL